MKVLLLFDQTQAGLGGKESADLPLGGKMQAIGSANMFEDYLKSKDGHIVATLWCGDKTFLDDEESVTKKLCAMIKKIQPDVVIGGPCFNYPNYALMCASVAKMTNEVLEIPAFAIMSDDCTKAIETYKDSVKLLKMPKKGGIGLTDALHNMCDYAKMLVDKEDTKAFEEEHTY